MENIIETRYQNIFRFLHSKYSLPVSIHLLQRFNSDSNACSSLFCGITSSSRVVAVSMVEMSLKKHPFNFNFGNRQKSHGAKSGEYDRFWPSDLSKLWDKRDKNVMSIVLIFYGTFRVFLACGKFFGSYWKHHVLSPVTINFRKFGSFLAAATISLEWLIRIDFNTAKKVILE